MTKPRRPQSLKSAGEPGEGSPFEPQDPPMGIDYKALFREALLHVPRQALAQVAEEGMPEGHHFYLSFRPRDPEVDVPSFLRDQYPDELTIILQHQFWSLEVDETAFSVVLSFGGRRHRLFIPFSSLTKFQDPYAAFGVNFDSADEADGEAGEVEEAAEEREERPVAAPEGDEGNGGVLRFDPSRRK